MKALVPIRLESGDIHVDSEHVSTVYLGGTGDTVIRYKDGDYQIVPGDVVAQAVSVINEDRSNG